MRIKIEIDVQPDELRRFLGLPDVAGLQDDVVRFLREKVSAAGETFDPTAVLQGSLELIRRNPTWKLLRSAMTRDRDDDQDAPQADPTPPAKPARRPRKAAAGKGRAASPAPRRRKSPTRDPG